MESVSSVAHGAGHSVHSTLTLTWQPHFFSTSLGPPSPGTFPTMVVSGTSCLTVDCSRAIYYWIYDMFQLARSLALSHQVE